MLNIISKKILLYKKEYLKKSSSLCEIETDISEFASRQGRRNEKEARGADNFKKAHCNYFELKPGFIDAQ